MDRFWDPGVGRVDNPPGQTYSKEKGDDSQVLVQVCHRIAGSEPESSLS